jgi:hypothetical protein
LYSPIRAEHADGDGRSQDHPYQVDRRCSFSGGEVMAFRSGQRVACIDDKWDWPGSHPVKGEVYTIAAVVPHRDGTKHCPHLVIVGFSFQYAQQNFRPLVERKTDISIFTAMLNTSKQGVEA